MADVTVPSDRAATSLTSRGRFRVLHFISDSHATGYFPLVARHTDRCRFDMRVASLGRAGGLQAGLEEIGISSFALNAERRSQYPAAVVRLTWWLRRNRIDVVHAHLFEASVVGLLAARAAGTKLRIFTGHHSHEVPLHDRRLFFEVDRFAARTLADVVIAPSQEMRDTFLSVYGCDPRDVVLIEHGLDLRRFDPARVDGASVRAELGLGGKLVFGTMSKHHWVKNLDSLVRAFAALVVTRDDVHLLILGDGDSSAVAGLVSELGLTPYVSILPRRGDVPELLAAMDVFVHPALAESFGFAIVEAMAMAKPVVTTNVGIARDVIEDGVSGIRASGTDPESLTEALTRAIAWRDRWPQLGAEASHRAKAFTAERWVEAHEKLYELRLRVRRDRSSPARGL